MNVGVGEAKKMKEKNGQDRIGQKDNLVFMYAKQNTLNDGILFDIQEIYITQNSTSKYTIMLSQDYGG